MSPPQSSQPGGNTPATPTTARTANVALSCRPDRAGNRLVFPYTVTNHGAADVYVMDALPMVDPVSGQATVDPNAAVIWLGSDGFAHILKGIAPLPAARQVTVRVIPLAAKLPPGDSLTRSLEVPLPLAEIGPYNPDLPLREYELVDIQGVVLALDFLPATVEGFAAEEPPFAPGLYRVRGRETVAQTERVSCAFPSRQLQILKRGDDFPRPD